MTMPDNTLASTKQLATEDVIVDSTAATVSTTVARAGSGSKPASSPPSRFGSGLVSTVATVALLVVAYLSLAVFMALFVATPYARGEVYVYEVNTLERRYVTVSRLIPDAYRYYNGGDDVIAELKVLKTYPNGNYQQAMADYNIQGNNYGPLPPQDAQHDLSFRPYIWWR